MKDKIKEKVLLLCYYFPPMGMGGTQRSAKFAKYLAGFGWQPHVITVKNVSYYAHDKSLLDELENAIIHRTESFDPLRLLARYKYFKKNQPDLKNVKKSKGLLQILNDIIGGFLLIPDSKILWLPFAIIKALHLIRKYHIKIVYTTSPPHSAHIGGLMLKLIASVKWVTDFRDDWTGGESQPCPTAIHYAINRMLELLVLKHADHVVGMCDHLTQVLQKKSHSYTEKFSTIMNGYDSDDFNKILNLPLNEKFTITHCGSISRVSNPEPFLKGVRLLLDQHEAIGKQIQIQFIGTDIFEQIQQLIIKYKLQQVVKPIQYLPHQQALKKVMTSHILLITIIKKTEEEVISGKIFEYLAAGKQILLISSPGYVANLMTTLSRGSVVEPEDSTAIKDIIYHHFRLFLKGRLHTYKPLSLEQFDRKYLTLKLSEIFKSLSR